MGLPVESSVTPQDPPALTIMVDERFQEILARLPKGMQADFATVFSDVAEMEWEIARLTALEREGKTNERGDIRVERESFTYMATVQRKVVKDDGTETGEEIEVDELRTGTVFSVIPKKRIPLDIKKLHAAKEQLLAFGNRMYRLYTADDGKSRKEMVDVAKGTQSPFRSAQGQEAPVLFRMLGDAGVPEKKEKKGWFGKGKS